MNALILLSGGLDSCVLLAYALSKGRSCSALSFNYGQRHAIELESAAKIASHYGVDHHCICVDKTIFENSNSSLVNHSIEVTPTSAYVPCRNLLFLASAASFAEAQGASEIYFGSNADDAASFPDCRPAFIETVERAISLGSKTKLSIVTPFIGLSKAQIIEQGASLGAPLHLSWSCYQPTDESKPCGQCPACLLRNPRR